MPNSWELDERGRIIRNPLRDVRQTPGDVPAVDLDASPYRRLCVNAQWMAHVAGAIDRLSDNDAWQGTPEDIARAQDAVDRIFEQIGELFDQCPSSTVIIEEITRTVTEYIYSGGNDCEDTCMGCSGCIRWNNGVLEVLDCGEWKAVAGNAEKPPTSDGTDVSDPTVPQIGDDPDVEQNVKCRVAWMIAHAMWRVHERIVDYTDDVLALFDIGNKVASDLPEYTLNKYHISIAAGDLISALVGLDLDLAFGTESETTSDLAAYISKFIPSVYTLTEVQYYALGTALIGYSLHEGVEVNLGQFVEGDYWRNVFYALGPGTVSELGAAARTLSEDEFACDEKTVTPAILTDTNGTLIFSGTYSNLNPSGAFSNFVLRSDKEVDFDFTCLENENPSLRVNFQTEQSGDVYEVETTLIAREGAALDLPLYVWSSSVPPSPANFARPILTNVSPEPDTSYYSTPTSQVTRFVADAPMPDFDIKFDTMRGSPNQTEGTMGKVYKLRLTITYSGAKR